MQEILYLEVPTPDIGAVRTCWLQNERACPVRVKLGAAEGAIVNLEQGSNGNTFPADKIPQISVFIWSVQQTTYLKAFR